MSLAYQILIANAEVSIIEEGWRYIAELNEEEENLTYGTSQPVVPFH